MALCFQLATTVVVTVALCTQCLASGWKAGTASAVITPRQPMPMAGYASRGAKHATGQLTDLYAKALVLEDAEGRRAVLVTLDLIGMERYLGSDIAEMLQREHGLKRSEIALCCSHTHTGPVVATNLRPMHYLLLDDADRKLVDEYAGFLKVRIREVVADAMQSLSPAEVASGEGTATFAVNRRENRADDVPKLRAAGKLKGPFDHAVPVLAVRTNGKLTAVVFGYACHCTVLSTFDWSGDYAGFAQLELEEKHPGCVALFWAGCGGDQNPLPRRKVEHAKQYGRDLAAAVDDVLKSDMHAVSPGLGTSHAEIPLEFGEMPSRGAVAADAESSNKYVAARAKAILAQLDAGETLPTTYPYPVTLWNLGNRVRWFFLGGEVVVDYAIRIEAELSDDTRADHQVWVAAYAQDVMAYIPSRRVLTEGGYEGGGAMVYYGHPTVWSPNAEEQIMAEVHRQASIE